MQGKHGNKHNPGSARIVRIAMPHFEARVSVDAVNAPVPTIPGSTFGVGGGQGVVVAVAPPAPTTLAELATLAGVAEADL